MINLLDCHTLSKAVKLSVRNSIAPYTTIFPKDVFCGRYAGYYFLKFYHNTCCLWASHRVIDISKMWDGLYIGTVDTTVLYQMFNLMASHSTVLYQMFNLLASHCNINALASRAND